MVLCFSDVKNSYSKITKECLSKEKQEFLNSLHLRDGFLDDLRKAKDGAILLVIFDCFKK